MAASLLPVARFPLPDNWEVEDTICVTFVIPDDPQYLATITGLVDELKWSRSFARDATGTGAAIVSRTWADALESQPVFTQGCDMPEFRIGEDCSLEVNCGTEEEPDWQPVFTSEHPEGGAEVPYPPDTPEYEDDTARCISAANIAAQLKYGTETLANDAAIVGGIAIAIIDLLGAFLFFVPGGVLIDIAIAIINVGVGHVAADFADDLPEIDWEDVRDNLACFLERDGSMTESDKAEFLSWMGDQYAGNLAWELSKIIVQNVSADGLTNDARMPQNDISIEGCPPCNSTCEEYDLTLTDGGLYVHPDLPFGHWTDGVGWESDLDTPFWHVYLFLDVDPSKTITRVEMDYTITHTAGYFNEIGIGPVGYEQHPAAEDVGTAIWDGEQLSDQLNLSITAQWQIVISRMKFCYIVE